MNYQHPERPCIKVTRVNGRGYWEPGRAGKGRRERPAGPSRKEDEASRPDQYKTTQADSHVAMWKIYMEMFDGPPISS